MPTSRAGVAVGRTGWCRVLDSGSPLRVESSAVRPWSFIGLTPASCCLRTRLAPGVGKAVVASLQWSRRDG
jgi:hypothetical protein